MRRFDGDLFADEPEDRTRELKTLIGELTIDNLRQNDHGVYECVVTNDVATIVARTALR